MAYVGQIVDIFVSSPGDVAEHRNSIVSIVQAWNQRNGRSRRLFFNCLRWEDLVAPDIGESGQDVTNSQVGDEYDIFLGVMWARFGTPTVNAESGTEEEFDRAIDRHQAGEPLRVSFLFCTADVPISKLDGGQFAKVQEFKSKAQQKGCLTRDFVDEASLINSINLILDRFANTWEGDEQAVLTRSSHRETIEASPESLESKDEPDEPGLFDVVEDFQEHSGQFAESLSRWGERLNLVQVSTEVATSKLSDLSKFGKPSPTDVRAILSNVCEVMDDFGRWCEDEIVELEAVMDKLSRDSLAMMDVSRDMEEPVDDILAARAALIQTHQSISDANGGILSFADAVESSPKLDKKLNRANRKVVEVHRRLAEKNRIFQEDVALCISDLDERLILRGSA